jgi:DNA repair exonuclease SbcCD ATPase subunit
LATRLRKIKNDEGKLQKERKTLFDFEKKFTQLKQSFNIAKENSIINDTANLTEIEEFLQNAEEEIMPLVKYFRTNFEDEEPKNEAKNEEQQKQEIVIQDLQNNQDILNQRRDQLQEIHGVSSQIKDMTDTMVNKVNEQGAILDTIEGNVIESEDNAKKAKQEIKKADEMSKGNNKRMYCFIAIIAIAILAITAIILSVIFGSS